MAYPLFVQSSIIFHPEIALFLHFSDINFELRLEIVCFSSSLLKKQRVEGLLINTFQLLPAVFDQFRRGDDVSVSNAIPEFQLLPDSDSLPPVQPFTQLGHTE